jgi:hypothetical protein
MGLKDEVKDREDPLNRPRTEVLGALRTNYGVATHAEKESICDAIPNGRGHAAMTSLLERGEALIDQCGNFRARERMEVVVDGHTVRL